MGSASAIGWAGVEDHARWRELWYNVGRVAFRGFSGGNACRPCDAAALARAYDTLGVTRGGTEVLTEMKTCLKCHCGQRIIRRDVMQQGYYVRQVGPSFVYIKFRCSRCKKLGEHYVKQDEWEDALLQENNTELTNDERGRFQSLGPITLNEMKDFHFTLESLQALPDSNRGKQRSPAGNGRLKQTQNLCGNFPLMISKPELKRELPAR